MSQHLTITLTPEEKQELRELAAKNGTTMSPYARTLVLAELERARAEHASSRKGRP